MKMPIKEENAADHCMHMMNPEKFLNMISSDKYVIRVRGFRLFCKQAKWDKDYLLDERYHAQFDCKGY